jgi:hypothetical protein|tara:strand:- start:130 stop:279 length:150 start_codon:yes stop_codon:yes gene_type:complete
MVKQCWDLGNALRTFPGAPLGLLIRHSPHGFRGGFLFAKAAFVVVHVRA